MESSDSPTWGNDVSAAMTTAIAFYHLRDIGWQGFDKLDWTQKLLSKHPMLPVVLLSLKADSDTCYAVLEELAVSMSDLDRQRLRDYIIGKLALEDMNCIKDASACKAHRDALFRAAQMSLTWK